MKLKNRLLYIILSGMLISSCSKEETPNVSDKYPLTFTTAIGASATRAIDNTWEDNDEIGIFMKTGGQSLSDASIRETGNNSQYITRSNSLFVPATADQEIYFPENNSQVDFIAYYPFNDALSGYMYEINTADQSSQNAIDFLYSDNASGISATSSPVNLEFHHKLTKLVMNIEAGSGVKSLEGLKVKITGMSTRGTFDLDTGTLTPDSESVADIEAKTTVVDDSKTLAEAIVFPTDDVNGASIVFTIESKTFTWEIPSPTKYQEGKKYTYNIVLKNNTVVVLNPSATIQNWVSMSAEDIVVWEDNDDDNEPAPGSDKETFFSETFGEGEYSTAQTRLKIAAFTDWDMTDPISYSDEFANTEIRSTAQLSASLWFPPNLDSSLKIDYIDCDNFTDIELSYDIAANKINCNVNAISVECDGILLTDIPDIVMPEGNKYQTVTVSIPDHTTSIRFYSATDINTVGYRIDNIILRGMKP